MSGTSSWEPEAILHCFKVYPWRTGENPNAMIHSPVHMLRHMRLSCTDTGISGIRPEPILTKSGGKSCWSMLTVLLASAGRRLCVQGDMELILLLPLLPAPGASAPCTPATGGQQTTVYKHATTCWVLGWVVQQLDIISSDHH